MFNTLPKNSNQTSKKALSKEDEMRMKKHHQLIQEQIKLAKLIADRKDPKKIEQLEKEVQRKNYILAFLLSFFIGTSYYLAMRMIKQDDFSDIDVDEIKHRVQMKLAKEEADKLAASNGKL